MVATLIFVTFVLSMIFYFIFHFISLRSQRKIRGEKEKFKKVQKLKPLPRLSLLKLVVEAVICTGSLSFDHGYFLNFFRKVNKIVEIGFWKTRAVAINDLHLAKELYKNPIFCGKDSTEMIKMFANGSYGLINTDGKRWKKNRQFVHQNLKEFGFGTKSMESHIQTEVSDLIESWASKKGQVFSPNKCFYLPVLNAIWVILTGDRASMLDKELVELVYRVYDGFRKSLVFPEVFLAATRITLEDIARINKWIPIFPGFKGFVKSVTELRTYFKTIIATRKKSLDLNYPSTNLVDAFLAEMDKTTDVDSEFFGETGELNLLATMVELFIAGGDTTANMLAWTMLQLIRNPEMQEKIRIEIDNAVPRHSYPTLQDRPNCPFTEAFLLETLRSNPVTCTGMPHSVTEDTNIGEYCVTKGTILTINIYGIQHDPVIWGDPETFRPERFLSQDGKSVLKHEALCIFSLGQRRCVGETVARDTLFLFTSAICQRFILKPDPRLNGVLPSVGFAKSIIHIPDTFDMVAVDRLLNLV